MSSSPTRTWLPLATAAAGLCLSATVEAAECWTVTRMVAVDAQGRARPTERLDHAFRDRADTREPVTAGLDLCAGDTLVLSQARIELQRTVGSADDEQVETALVHNDTADEATVELAGASSWSTLGLDALYLQLHQALNFTYDRWLNGSNEGTELVLVSQGSGVLAATLDGRIGAGAGQDRTLIAKGAHAAFSEQGPEPVAERSGLVERDRFATRGWLQGSPIWMAGVLAGPVLMGSDPGLKIRAYTRLRTWTWLRVDAELAGVLTTTRGSVYDADGDGFPSMANELTVWHVPLTLGLELGPAPISLNPQALAIIECETRRTSGSAEATGGCAIRPHLGGLVGLRGELMRRRHLGLLWSARGGAVLTQDDGVDLYIDLAVGVGGGW